MAETKQSVIDKVTAHVNAVHAGSWEKAFAHHDGDGDGRISHAEMNGILAASGVGFRLSRGAIASQVLVALDADADGFVTWAEFAAMRAAAG